MRGARVARFSSSIVIVIAALLASCKADPSIAKEWDEQWDIKAPETTATGWRVQAPVSGRILDRGDSLVVSLDKRDSLYRGRFGDGQHAHLGAAAFRKDTGRLVWKRYGTLSASAAFGGLVFMYARTGRLVARSLGDGAEVWRLKLPDDRSAKSPREPLSTFIGDVVVRGDRLYVAAGKQVFIVSSSGKKIASSVVCQGDGSVVDRITWHESAGLILATCTRRSYYDDSSSNQRIRHFSGPLIDYHRQRTERDPRRRDEETVFAGLAPSTLRVLWTGPVVPNGGGYSTLPADTGDGGFVMQLREVENEAGGFNNHGLLVRADARTGKLAWVAKTPFLPAHDAIVIGEKTLSNRLLYGLADGTKLKSLWSTSTPANQRYRGTVAGPGHTLFLWDREVRRLDADGVVRDVASIRGPGKRDRGDVSMLTQPLVLGDNFYFGYRSSGSLWFLEKLSLKR